MTRREFSPAMVGSVALHATAALLMMISWHSTKVLKIGSAVPVTLVANAPDADIRPAIAAPEAQEAATEQPTPEAPPTPTPPVPKPAPAPTPPAPAPPAKPAPPPPRPTPAPTPVPTPKPAPEKPQAPARPAKPAETSFDMDALAASLSKSTPGAKASSAAKGPARPETATQARPTTGTGVSALAMNGLVSELQRLWHPNCDVEGGRDVVVKTRFTFGAGGVVTGQPTSQIVSAATPAALVGKDRAARAIFGLQPSHVPRELYDQPVTVTFNAREACAQQ